MAWDLASLTSMNQPTGAGGAWNSTPGGAGTFSNILPPGQPGGLSSGVFGSPNGSMGQPEPAAPALQAPPFAGGQPPGQNPSWGASPMSAPPQAPPGLISSSVGTPGATSSPGISAGAEAASPQAAPPAFMGSSPGTGFGGPPPGSFGGGQFAGLRSGMLNRFGRRF